MKQTQCTSLSIVLSSRRRAPRRAEDAPSDLKALLRTGALLATVAVLTPASGPATADDSSGVLSLQEAVSHALEASPELAIFSAEMRASEARLVHARVRRNPDAAVEFEDFAGSGVLAGAGQMQTTLRLSNLVELGGKRARRREVAANARDLAGLEYEIKRIDVLANVTARFIAVVGAQETLVLARETTASAEATLRIIRQRVEAGRTSLLEEKKAAVALARSRIEEARAERELTAERTRLAATWGSAAAEFDRAEADLFTLDTLPAFDSLVTRIAGSPEIARWTTERRLRESEIRLARTKRTPDVTVSAGGRRLEDSGDYGFVAGVSLPLSIFDRNQGGVAESQALLDKSAAAQRAAETEWRAAISSLHQNLLSASNEVESTNGEILPQAEESLRIAELGYREARFSYLELADAQRTLLEVRRQHLAAAMTYHLIVVEIERLTGLPLNP